MDVNDSRVSVMYGRATRTSITVLSKFPTKTWGAAHVQTVDVRRSSAQLLSTWERGYTVLGMMELVKETFHTFQSAISIFALIY